MKREFFLDLIIIAALLASILFSFLMGRITANGKQKATDTGMLQSSEAPYLQPVPVPHEMISKTMLKDPGTFTLSY